MIKDAQNPNGTTVRKGRGLRFRRYGSYGKTAYRRERHLAALIACWPDEIRDMGAETTTRIVAALKAAVRAERRRGRAGHWTYDLNRHISLVEALKAERARLAAITNRRETIAARRASDAPARLES